jgi:hypothetical protein
MAKAGNVARVAQGSLGDPDRDHRQGEADIPGPEEPGQRLAQLVRARDGDAGAEGALEDV